ncbi:uncharacterized protein VTP21DRAFT_7783 [Calcarisporiella thermophila]|uniref:uncharacterized protein n=1 Tax=Calcarisporiella thermophila TaxID=911321 RepID=UPI00374415ED
MWVNSYVFVFFTSALIVKGQCKCRCLPNDSCWPDLNAWNEFNVSVGGQLLVPTPPASPCHDPTFNETACDIAKQKRINPFWRSDQAGAMQNTNWEMNGNERCTVSEDRTAPCLPGAIPAYAVKAIGVSDIQKTVEFAAKHNLRLVVKNTGHDYLGRSTAPGSLSIWTHFLKNYTFHDSFIPEGCDSSANVPAVTVEAGTQWDEIYDAAEKNNLTVVGGNSLTVGAAGGYVQGGGHSAHSPKYGLSVDNIIQFTVVTADGKLRVVNACQNRELFWALRGGGGGTYGAVVTVTHKTYKAPDNVSGFYFSANTTDTENFKELLKEFLRINPSLAETGWGGYFYISDNSLLVTYLYPDTNSSLANETVAPLLNYANNRTGISSMGIMTNHASFYAWHRSISCAAFKDICTDPVGKNVLLGSRLIPKEYFENEDKMKLFIDTLITLSKERGLLGHLVAGGAVIRNNGSETSVNPAWRKAIWHIVLTNDLADNATIEQQKAVAEDITRSTQLLRDITPDSGCYLNEADVNEPNWQQAFFGENYSRLKTIKDEIDPDGLFVCKNCVGSEEWSPDLNCSKN